MQKVALILFLGFSPEKTKVVIKETIDDRIKQL